MHVHRFPPLTGAYSLASVPSLSLNGASEAVTGLVHFGAGARSPENGMRVSAAHELGYVVSGRLRIDTAQSSYEVRAGDVLVASPALAHSTTALEDSEIFFVLLDPMRALTA